MIPECIAPTPTPIEPLVPYLRRTFGATWPKFRKDWAGFDDDGMIFVDTPDARRGQHRLLGAAYAAGARHPLMPPISADYTGLMLRLWRFEMPNLSINDLATVVASVEALEHPVDRPIIAMSGRTFRWLVAYFEGLGHNVRSRLARSDLSAHDLSYLTEVRRQAGIDDAAFDDMLRDFGGGVFFAKHLDRAGFERIDVAIDAKIVGLWQPGVWTP